METALAKGIAGHTDPTQPSWVPFFSSLLLRISKERAANGFSPWRQLTIKPDQRHLMAHTRDSALRSLRQEDSCSKAA